MKYFFISYVLVAALVLCALGTRGSKSELPPLELFPDMDQQAKVKYQAKSEFFADGYGARKPVPHTIPMGFEVPNKPVSEGAEPPRFGFSNGVDYYSTGKMGAVYGDGLPEEIIKQVDKDFIERGKQRYNINCAICHGMVGNGKGITSKFGIMNAFNFHMNGSIDPKNPAAYRPDGAIFDVITNGKGLMGAYGGNINVRDRWAIVAYIRTMQLAAKQNKVTFN
jgi:Cytochrome C oxidase, cbb3-type, subunit III